MTTSKITIEPYTPLWAKQFSDLANQLRPIFGSNLLAIHHAGSTSIPGLAAKPILDIFIGVTDITDVDRINSEMIALGFEAKGEFGIAFRRFFTRRSRSPQANIHVFEHDSTEIARHLLFRDYLIQHPDDRDEYVQLKQRLAQQYPNDIYHYVTGKSDFVKRIDRATGYQGEQLVQVLTEEEQTAYQQLIGESAGKNPNHRYFVYSRNLELVGAMHIVMDPQPHINKIATKNDNPRFEASLRALGARWCQLAHN